MIKTGKAIRPILAMLAISLVVTGPIVLAYILGEPKIYVDPDQIPLNGTTNIHLTVDTSTGPPNSDFEYYVVNQLTAMYPPFTPVPPGPEKYSFALGTASIPSIQGQPITVHIGDDFVVPFGPGVGAITIDGQIYWWWIIKENGAPVNPSKRLDVWGQSPTQWKGTYMADMDGVAYYLQYPQGQIVERHFSFDTWDTFTVPELGIAIAALLGLTALSLKKKAK